MQNLQGNILLLKSETCLSSPVVSKSEGNRHNIWPVCNLIHSLLRRHTCLVPV